MSAGGECFTDRCRRLLSEQPTQREFTLSRQALEVLVSDSERYAERNRHDVEDHLALKRAYPDAIPLETQLEQLRVKYPEANVFEPNKFGHRLLSVPGVRLPKGWKPRSTTIYVIIPPDFPRAQPERFYTPRDVRLDHGGMPTNTAFEGTAYGGALVTNLMWWHWHICSPNYRHSLVQYISAMRQRFEVKQ